MNASREHTRSIWMDVDVFPRAPMLDRDVTADTVVVGSGIAGLSTAYELAIRGQKVIVIDRGPAASPRALPRISHHSAMNPLPV